MANMRDVAKLCGVSPASVSRILSEDGSFKVRETTRRKVLDAANQLGYVHPNADMGIKRIGCALSYTAERYSDKYFSTILSAAEKALLGTGYTLSLFYTIAELAGDGEKLKRDSPAGLLLLDDALPPDRLEKLNGIVPHMVGVDTDYEGIDNVSHDKYRTGRQAMEHLIGRGHSRIAYIGGEECALLGREHSYIDLMSLRNFAMPEDYILDCNWDPDRCYEMTVRLCSRDDRPTAIFAGSDNLAIAVLSAVYSSGLTVPGDVAVVGVNNLDFSAFTSPPLTTVSIPMEEIGAAAVSLLLRRIGGFTGIPMHILFPSKLIVREST